MTENQFFAIVKLTRMQPEGTSTKAAKMVLVDRVKPSHAADACGITRVSVSSATRRVKEALELAKIAAGQ